MSGPFEPYAIECGRSGTLKGHEVVAMSSAISLKRIADALEKLNTGDVNGYGIGAEIGRGMGEHFVAVMAKSGR